MEKIIYRAQRILELAKLNAPSVILRNEGRMLADLIDKLPVLPSVPRSEPDTWDYL
jgi:DNA-directed RNA polymerase beta' subunit